MDAFKRYYDELRDSNSEDHREITESYLQELRLQSIMGEQDPEELVAQLLQMVVSSAINKLIKDQRLQAGYAFDVRTGNIFMKISQDLSYYMEYDNFIELSQEAYDVFSKNITYEDEYKVDFRIGNDAFSIDETSNILLKLPVLCPQ